MATYTKANSASQNANGGTLSSQAVPATTVGNLGIIGISHDSATTVSSVTGGGTWARVGTAQTDGSHPQTNEFWWTIFTSSVTSIAFTTIDTPSSTAYVEMNSDVGFAASALDVQNTSKAYGTTTTSTDAETSNSITPAASGELLIAVGYDDSGTAPTWTQGTGWNMGIAEPGQAGNNTSTVIEWKTGGSGSQNATLTINKTGDDYVMQIAAFKPLAGNIKAGSGIIGP